MRETGLDSQPRLTSPRKTASNPRWPMAGDREGPSPALMLPPRLGVLRRPSGDSTAPLQRLIVPVPSTDFDEAEFGRLVWQLAAAADVGILLLAMLDGTRDDLFVRRRLTTLAAFLHRPHSTVETAVERDRSWIRALRRVVRDDDLIVCPPEEGGTAGTNARSLADGVVTELHLPAYLLDGFPSLQDKGPRFELRRILAWVAPLAVLAAFAGVQIQIVIQTMGWLQTLLLAASVGLELASVLAVEGLVAAWR